CASADGPRSSASSPPSTPSKPSVSIRLTPRRITGGTSTIASVSDTSRVPTAATSTAPGFYGRRCCHDALRLRHDHVFRAAGFRRSGDLSRLAEVHLELQRQR